MDFYSTWFPKKTSHVMAAPAMSYQNSGNINKEFSKTGNAKVLFSSRSCGSNTPGCRGTSSSKQSHSLNNYFLNIPSFPSFTVLLTLPGILSLTRMKYDVDFDNKQMW